MKKYGVLKTFLIALIAACESLRMYVAPGTTWQSLLTPEILVGAAHASAIAIVAFLFQSPINPKYVSGTLESDIVENNIQNDVENDTESQSGSDN